MALNCRQPFPKEFVMRDEEYYRRVARDPWHKGGYFPKMQGLVWWMASEDNRDFLSEVISAGRRAFRMHPVKSNEELISRIEEYFSIVQGRRVPPTVEEFSLYLGYSVKVLRELILGQAVGFPDVAKYGETSAILTRAMDVLHSADAIQAMRRMSDASTYIFRSKNYYDMRDTRDAPIMVSFVTPEALPADQIAKMLPDLAQDRNMDDVTVI